MKKLLSPMNVLVAMVLSSPPCFAQTYAGFRDVRPESTECILNGARRVF